MKMLLPSHKNEEILHFETIVLGYFALFLLTTVLYNSFLPITYYWVAFTLHLAQLILRLAIIAVAIIKIYNKGISVRDASIIAVLFILSLLVFWKNHDFLFFDAFFPAFVFYDVVDYKKIAKVSFISIAGSTILLIFMHFCGIMQEETFVRGERVRYALGFTHPNSLGRVCLILTLLHITIRREKIGIFDICGIVAIAAFTKVVPDSQTSTALLLLVAVLLVAEKFIRSKEKIYNSKALKWILFLFVPVLISIIYLCIYNSDISKIYPYIGSMASRFSLSKMCIDNYGFHLLGRDDIIISFAQENYFTVDMFYVYLPAFYGIIAAIAFMGIYMYLYYKAIIKSDSFLVIVYLVLSVYALSELSLNTFYVSAFYLMSMCGLNNEQMIQN